jgi:hypothetical protein
MPFTKKKQGRNKGTRSILARKRKGKQKVSKKQNASKASDSNFTRPPPAMTVITPDPPTNARRSERKVTDLNIDNQQSTEVEVEEFLKEERNQSLIDTSINTRHAIIYKFRTSYNEAPDTDATPWGGKGGIISRIKKDLEIPRGTDSSMIRNTLDEYLMAKEGGFEWKPLKGNVCCKLANHSATPAAVG